MAARKGWGTDVRGLVVLTALACSLLGASTARAQPATDSGLVVAVFPPVLRDTSAQDRVYMALLIQAHAVELLAATGKYNDLHVKQIRRMAEHEGRDLLTAFSTKDQAVPTAKRLGADRTAFGELFYQRGLYLLKARAARIDQPERIAEEELQLPENKLEAVRAGGQLLAKLLAKLDGVSVPASVPGVTQASSEAALASFGKCYALLVDESFRSDSPGLLDTAVLGTAFQRCQEAVKSDPGFASAYASHSLAWVLLVAQGGDANEARTALESLLSHEPKADDYQPFFWMALYWMAARFDPASENAELVLRAALKRHPRSLILHAFLGRHLNYIERYADAEKVWREYLRLSPRSPYVMEKLSYTLARLNRQEEAVELAKKASLADPKNPEALLGLASRYIDSKQWALAVATLSPLLAGQGGAGSQEVRGEILLRLGYAYMQLPKPDLVNAEKYLKMARQQASRPSEWKTRARAERDLAEVYRRQGKNELVANAMADFKKQASSRYIKRQADQDEALAKLLKEEAATAEKESTLYFRPAPLQLAVKAPRTETPPPAKGLCSNTIGICFSFGTQGPMGSSRKIDPAATQSPLGSTFNQ